MATSPCVGLTRDFLRVCCCRGCRRPIAPPCLEKGVAVDMGVAAAAAAMPLTIGNALAIETVDDARNTDDMTKERNPAAAARVMGINLRVPADK